MKPFFLVQTGDMPEAIQAGTCNFPELFWTIARLDMNATRHLRVFAGEELPNPAECGGAVITGSHSMVTERQPWSEYTAGWLRNAFRAHVPLFGVCYGHQLLAHALGGVVDYHPRGTELGTFTMRLTEAGRVDPFTAFLPATFPANLAHSQTVLTLPNGATVLASSDHDPHQIIRYGDHAVSVQFHPEFDRTTMLAYLDQAEKDHPEEKDRFTRLRNEATDTPLAAGLVRRFFGLDDRVK